MPLQDRLAFLNDTTKVPRSSVDPVDELTVRMLEEPADLKEAVRSAFGNLSGYTHLSSPSSEPAGGSGSSDVLARVVVATGDLARGSDGAREVHRSLGIKGLGPVDLDGHVVVEADVFADGHDELGAVLLYRKGEGGPWSSVPMTPLGNDRWTARFRLATVTWPTTPLDPFFNANTMDDIAEAERLAALDGG